MGGVGAAVLVIALLKHDNNSAIGDDDSFDSVTAAAASARKIAMRPQCSSAITALDVSRNKIGKQGAVVMAELLQSSPTITHLDLSVIDI
jgi:hypothetical protein